MSSTSASANTGTSTSIRVDGSPVVRSYVRFSVASVTGTVSQAVLRVYANSSQSTGYSVSAVADSSWSETGITYANAPPLAAAATGSSGRVAAGTWTSVDVTSLVGGNGTYSFGLATSSSTALSLASRESGANAPQLVLSTTSSQAVPANTAPPSIAGVPQQGQPSGAGPGSWSGSPSSFAYRWRRCTSQTDASMCADVAGAGAQSYTPVAADVGAYLRVAVTATNGAGTSAPAESAAVGPVTAQPSVSVPVNTARPSIAGVPQQGQPSGAGPGSWSGSPSSFAYRWRRCTSQTDASMCADVAGAGAQSYTPVAADVGAYLRVAVTATNGAGTSASVESDAAGPVAAMPPPANTTPPAVTGTPEVGRALRADPGSWNGNPTSFAYTWRVCTSQTDASTCTDPGGQQGQTYTPQVSDVGNYLRVAVTATNAGGTSAPVATSAVGPVAAASRDPVVAAAGDIACDPASSSFNGGAGTSGSCHQRATSELLLGVDPAAVLTLGDNAYECGSATAFAQSFDPSWGRLKGVIRPAVGNHEYSTGTGCPTAASAYFAYFGVAAGDPAKGYYSYDVGGWHLIALNANCSKVGGCAAGQPEEQWLRADLASHQNACVLAYWHQPHFSSGQHGNDDGGGNPTGAFWQALYDFRADVVLSAHDHDYERFAPQTPAGAPDPASGIREFVVGTGGKSQSSFAVVKPNSEIRSSGAYGVLLLTLHPNGYEWQFVSEAGKSFSDAGSGSCH